MPRIRSIKEKTFPDVDPKDNLYIVRVHYREGSIIKLGYSSGIIDRLYTYFQYNPLTEVVATFYREDAKRIEKEFHRDHQAIILNEWYTEPDLFYMLAEIG